MAFESLTDKLQNVFKKLKGKGRLTEADVKVALKEVKMALLEADVNFKVVKQFTKSVQEKAIGQDVMNGLNPGQMVIKIVNDELVNLMGSETTELPIKPGMDLTLALIFSLRAAVTSLPNNCFAICLVPPISVFREHCQMSRLRSLYISQA